MVRHYPLRMPAPAPASSFVGPGRVELAQIAELTARERLVTVVGPAGCGKTRLAIESAANRPPLGSTSSRPRARQPTCPRGADRVRLPEEPGRDPMWTSSRPARPTGACSCWTTASTCARRSRRWPTRSCAAALSLRILATSRVALGADRRAGVPAGRELTRPPTAPRCCTTGPGRCSRISRRPDTDRAAAEICTLADGLPLAIELAAAHARALSARQTSATAWPTECVPHRPRSGGALRGTARWPPRWTGAPHLVGEPARRALAALSVHRTAVSRGGGPGVTDRERTWRRWSTTPWSSSTPPRVATVALGHRPRVRGRCWPRPGAVGSRTARLLDWADGLRQGDPRRARAGRTRSPASLRRRRRGRQLRPGRVAVTGHGDREAADIAVAVASLFAAVAAAKGSRRCGAWSPSSTRRCPRSRGRTAPSVYSGRDAAGSGDRRGGRRAAGGDRRPAARALIAHRHGAGVRRPGRRRARPRRSGGAGRARGRRLVRASRRPSAGLAHRRIPRADLAGAT